MKPRCSYTRHCGEEPVETFDNLPYCFDHYNEVKAEAERERLTVDHWPDSRDSIEPLSHEEHRSKHLDEHGRNKAVMRNARAM